MNQKYPTFFKYFPMSSKRKY